MDKVLVSLLVCVLRITTSGEVGEVNQDTKEFLDYMKKFYQKSVIDLIKNSSATEDTGQDLTELKRDALPIPSVAPIFHTATINIPANVYMRNVMFQLFGRGGILENGGFSRTGFIHRINASASIVLLGNFGNRSLFLNEVLAAHHSPINDSCLALVVQLFFTPEDFQRLINWLNQEVKSGYVNYDEPCSPIVKITYSCCTKIANPFLQPKFGTLRVEID
ncbi:uncharacterized protein [Montipora capricornis]|uniref:uncharacterized protein isoform X1 n=2 Tax=Montipora capricornis TaxID=246305 RepID=UPI0035F20EFB